MSFWLITLQRLTGNGSFSHKIKKAPGDNKGRYWIESKPRFFASADWVACTGHVSFGVSGPGPSSGIVPAPCRQIQGMRDPFNQHNRSVNMFGHVGVPAPSGYARYLLKPKAAQDGVRSNILNASGTRVPGQTRAGPDSGVMYPMCLMDGKTCK